MLTLCFNIHNYQTVSSSISKTFKPSYRTDSYKKTSVAVGGVNCWNKAQHQLSILPLKASSRTNTKSLLTENASANINEQVILW